MAGEKQRKKSILDSAVAFSPRKIFQASAEWRMFARIAGIK